MSSRWLKKFVMTKFGGRSYWGSLSEMFYFKCQSKNLHLNSYLRKYFSDDFLPVASPAATLTPTRKFHFEISI
jgi:hypothetical protein